MANNSGLDFNNWSIRVFQRSSTTGTTPAGAERRGGGPPFFNHDDTVRVTADALGDLSDGPTLTVQGSYIHVLLLRQHD